MGMPSLTIEARSGSVPKSLNTSEQMWTPLRNLKDLAGAVVVRRVLNLSPLRKLGTMTSLHIDSQNKQIRAVLELRGEPTPIEVLLYYQVSSPRRIDILQVESSREWISSLINEVLTPDQRRLPVPELVSKLL